MSLSRKMELHVEEIREESRSNKILHLAIVLKGVML